MKGYDLEGWAFAGAHQSSFTMLLNRLIDMNNDGFLERAKWIHVLDVSKLTNAYLFTTFLRCICNIGLHLKQLYGHGRTDPLQRQWWLFGQASVLVDCR
ncbi:hypothetical protein DKP76_18625 [Falsochrobactrum shanghaiense]|uniref:Uncharacterized protein n=1 Tax=Falsochrobactrum shanghaiense TaxID=2201899 RepID=A0A316J2T3_9HYPH|nr:hypothetical protein [Falsochrobactrum shanghaiense]PWL16222.1 hypothetical protein DKP76_18625 [Falsochrobactrum shanghaiense]